MKAGEQNKLLVSIDFRLYYLKVMSIIFFIGTAIFSLLLIFGLTTENNPIEKLLLLDAFFIAVLAWAIIQMRSRSALLRDILKRGILADCPLQETKTIRADQLRCYFFISGKKIHLDLRMQKKNRDRILEICQPGKQISLLYLPEKPRSFLIKELYQIQP